MTQLGRRSSLMMVGLSMASMCGMPVIGGQSCETHGFVYQLYDVLTKPENTIHVTADSLLTEADDGKPAITIHPVKIEAYDEVNDLVFTLEMFDDACANIDIKTVLNIGNVDEVFAAVKDGLAMMNL